MKIDLRKINFNESATFNIWYQLGINIRTYKGKKIDVTKYFMPEVEQDKLVEYMLKNYKKLKFYRHYNKKSIKQQISMERLCYFPSSVVKK